MTSTATPHQVWHSLEALGFFLTYVLSFFSFYAFDLLRLSHKVGRAFIYKLEEYFALVFICKLFTYQSMRLNHFRASPSSKKWPVSWMQLDLLPCAVVSLVISISQGILTRWQRFDTSKAINISQSILARWHKSLEITRDD